jgi:hypothetical protein
LNLRSVVRLPWASDLTGTVAWLSRAVDLARPGGARLPRPVVFAGSVAGVSARIRPREAWLRRDRPRSRNDRRTTLVNVEELLTVAGSLTLILKLCRHRRDSRAAHGCDLSRSWPNVDSASAAVVGHTGVVVNDDRAVVDVGDASDIDTVYSTVVVEVISIPIAAVVTDTGVAEAVVDAAVEAYMETPEAAVEAIAVAVEAPVAGCPKRAVVGRSAPRARNPVIAARTPTPIAGCPEIVGFGSLGLFVHRQWRRRLICIFDGRSLTVRIELIVGLRILVGLILIWRRRSRLLGCWLLRSVYLRDLLGPCLRSNTKNLTLSGRRSSG